MGKQPSEFTVHASGDDVTYREMRFHQSALCLKECPTTLWIGWKMGQCHQPDEPTAFLCKRQKLLLKHSKQSSESSDEVSRYMAAEVAYWTAQLKAGGRRMLHLTLV
ncbi:hypothetical protein CAPTEDRAFT_199235 [Capitella teleta]|uniref:Uncharacterized protein n=1 Tax=Capitella teleta TaxID=283909 RepID=R7T366_CAPTE|nr:hypothetical protein CAPTEDRAFT_199235 [Capitella teleta]|eukprot:ELT87038.1 hypothetical protein CAPTEDRAFT_199235 [Capitella teleta]